MSSFGMEEAYILGCLYGRGSVERERGGYKIKLRFSHVSYDEIGKSIVNELLLAPQGMTAEEILKIPKIKSSGISNLGLKLTQLRKWHPPRQKDKPPLLEHVGRRWKIKDRELAREYLRWQQLYLERKYSWLNFMMNHIRNVTSFFTSNIRPYTEISRFGHSTIVVECDILPITMKYLKDVYQIDVGDVYLHMSISDTILSKYERELLEEFVRGLADTTATLDRYINRKNPHYRVQFSIANQNLKIPVDVCFLLQSHLKIPVHYIGWGGTYARRGTRDHLVKVWVTNFEKRFNMPLFYNEQKQEEFVRALQESKATPLKEEYTKFCPEFRRKKGFMNECIKQGCRLL